MTFTVMSYKSDCLYIDGLVNGGVLVFTILWTYMSSKSGLSARKSESNSGDATINRSGLIRTILE